MSMPETKKVTLKNHGGRPNFQRRLRQTSQLLLAGRVSGDSVDIASSQRSSFESFRWRSCRWLVWSNCNRAPASATRVAPRSYQWRYGTGCAHRRTPEAVFRLRLKQDSRETTESRRRSRGRAPSCRAWRGGEFGASRERCRRWRNRAAKDDVRWSRRRCPRRERARRRGWTCRRGGRGCHQGSSPASDRTPHLRLKVTMKSSLNSYCEWYLQLWSRSTDRVYSGFTKNKRVKTWAHIYTHTYTHTHTNTHTHRQHIHTYTRARTYTHKHIYIYIYIYIYICIYI